MNPSPNFSREESREAMRLALDDVPANSRRDLRDDHRRPAAEPPHDNSIR